MKFTVGVVSSNRMEVEGCRDVGFSFRLPVSVNVKCPGDDSNEGRGDWFHPMWLIHWSQLKRAE